MPCSSVMTSASSSQCALHQLAEREEHLGPLATATTATTSRTPSLAAATAASTSARAGEHDLGLLLAASRGSRPGRAGVAVPRVGLPPIQCSIVLTRVLSSSVESLSVRRRSS